MYAQVTRAQLQPGKVDEALAILRDSVGPAARKQKGYRNGYLLVDREMNRGIVISFWEAQTDVTALATSGFYQEQVGKLVPLLAGPPEREVYEVVVGA